MELKHVQEGEITIINVKALIPIADNVESGIKPLSLNYATQYCGTNEQNLN